MWRLKVAEGSSPPLKTSNNFLGRAVWEFDHELGSPEERAEVERVRREFTERRFEKKEASDLLLRMQVSKWWMKSSSGWSSASTARKGQQLPLIDCPRCGIPVIRIRSKQQNTLDQIFFKCPNNIKVKSKLDLSLGLNSLQVHPLTRVPCSNQEDPRTCGFIRSEDQYERYLRSFDESCDAVADRQVKQEISDMKHELARINREIGQLKEQVRSKKCALVVAVIVGMIVGLLVRSVVN